jgi:hypothetical protein
MPLLAPGLASAFVSDDFNGTCGLLPAPWSFVDPVGDGAIALTGSGTGDAHLEISVPPGVSHDIWSTGNRAPRVVQPAANADFEAVAKFSSLPTQKYQGQGIYVEGAPGNHIRFEFFHNGSSLRVYSASFVANQPTQRINQTIPSQTPLFMRVRRQGDVWTLSYGANGVAWTQAVSFTHALAVGQIGLYALNHGVPTSASPAFTARVDYFENTAAPGPVLTEDQGPELEERTLSVQVSGNGTVQRDPEGDVHPCGAQVLLTALPAPGHGFTGWSGDVVSTENPLLVTLAEDLSLAASFAADVQPPVLSDVAVGVTQSSATVSWTTNEPATSQVAYGLTAAHSLGTESDASLVTDHQIVLSGLSPSTTYHYEITSVDGAGLAASSGDLTFRTRDPVPDAPQITLWYGAEQDLGQLGLPQPWVNILGNVQDPDGIASLTYTVNGGAARSLKRGPDGRRLQAAGDFNADVPVTDLAVGTNTIVLRAQDTVGNVSTANVTVDFDGTGVWPLPFTANWSAAAEISDVAQPVDGPWEIQGNAVRNLQVGYDRLLAIGDLSWTNYEVTVPITIHSFDPSVWTPEVIGPAAAVGVLLRWQGHTDARGNGPYDYPFPFGAICWYRIYSSTAQLEINRNLDAKPWPKKKRTLTLGATYLFKARVETVPGVGGLYRFKVWQQGQPEPAAWDLQQQEDLADPQSGSILLLTHYVDASFGPVTVSPLP